MIASETRFEAEFDAELRLYAMEAAFSCRQPNHALGDVLGQAQIVYDFLAGGRVTIHRGENGAVARVETLPATERMN